MANVLLDDFSKLEHEAWTRVTSLYDKSWANLTKQFIEPLLNAVGVQPGMKVLDVACGPGYVSHAIHSKQAIPIGVDFSSSMIQLAREFYPDIKFVEGDAQALNFPDREFDAVVMNFGMLHLSKPELAMAEARRVLRTEGRFGFTVWAGPDRSPTANVMFDNIMKYADQNVNMPEAPPSYYFSDEKLTTELLQRSGFDNVTFTDRLIEWIVPNAEYYFNTELNAGVRTGTFLRRQTPETLSVIKQAVIEAMQQFYDGNSYRLRFCGCVVAATKK
ncbi:MAG: methyltransferase domain-containing protein [Bacteroidetes bacterium]|nr:MAG: methyltransferase domain-containing protein [Bacteroidota bacterium]